MMTVPPLRTTVIGSYPFPGWLEFACGRLDSASSRVEYQVVASVHSCAIVTSGRSGTSRAAHHSRTRSSDRKKSMFAQV